MADTIQRVEYFYAQVPNKAGEGARFLTALQEAGINLLAFSGFPEGHGSQLDFVPADPAAFKQFARCQRPPKQSHPGSPIEGQCSTVTGLLDVGYGCMASW